MFWAQSSSKDYIRELLHVYIRRRANTQLTHIHHRKIQLSVVTLDSLLPLKLGDGQQNGHEQVFEVKPNRGIHHANLKVLLKSVWETSTFLSKSVKLLFVTLECMLHLLSKSVNYVSWVHATFTKCCFYANHNCMKSEVNQETKL